MSASLGLAVSMLALVAAPGIPVAQAVTTDVFTPTADSYVIATKPTTNNGTSPTLKADASPTTRSYLTFQVDVSAPIVDATLLLHSALGSPVGVSVHPVADTTWGELTITYSNAPAIGAPAVATGPLAAGWTSVDVSPLVTGPGPVSLALTTTTKSVIKMSSRQTGTTAPQLVVRTSSEPDVEPPSAPGDLAATATGATRVLVSWTASIDDVLVAGYDVFRDDQLVATVDGTTFSVVDTDLDPETTYSYEVVAFDASGNRSDPAGPATATTAAASVDPVVVAVGDIACDPASTWFQGGLGTDLYCRQMATSELALALEPSAVLTLGDLQYECGGYDAFLQSYDPSWGRLRAITYPAPGNHEYLTSAQSTGTGCAAEATAPGYFSYFGAAAGDPAQGWYSVDIGSWHVVALNSNCSKIGGCGIASPQGLWLKADLAANDAACTLAFMHFPRFSSGTHGGITSQGKFWELLYQDGAELVLAGHDHDYERFAPLDPAQQPDPLGLRSFVVGTGGKLLRPFSEIVQAGSEVRITDSYGVLRLTLHEGSYDWAFVATTGGEPLDSGTDTCH